MRESQPIRFQNEHGAFQVSESPTGQEVIGFIPLGEQVQRDVFDGERPQPVYLGGEVNRVACEPLYETEAREQREQADLGNVRRILGKMVKAEKDERHNKNLHGGPGIDGLTGFHHGTYYDKGVPRVPKNGR